jgi:hypothetical protein
MRIEEKKGPKGVQIYFAGDWSAFQVLTRRAGGPSVGLILRDSGPLTERHGYAKGDYRDHKLARPTNLML